MYLLPLVDADSGIALNDFLDILSKALDRIDKVCIQLKNEDPDTKFEILSKDDICKLKSADKIIKEFMRQGVGIGKN